MPDTNQILRRFARERGVRLDIVEKDYALSYLLAGIIETPGLGDQIILKGGTALKKAYYPDYRFSEDLDYSTLNANPTPRLIEKIAQAVENMKGLLDERGPFEVSYEQLLLREPHPGGQEAFLVRVRFPGQRQALCRLKIEITIDEPVLMPVETLELLHGFDESLVVSLRVYSLSEIVAEKLRALLQSRQRLIEKGWGASRVCRDYFDLWSILTREGPQDILIPKLVQQKCQLRGVVFQSVNDFLAEELQETAKREWTQQILPFIPNAPPVKMILSELQNTIIAYWH